jgi:hypothetical protein
MKFDGEKARMDLVPWDVVEKAARVFTYGAAKYDDRNYYGLSQSRLFGAVQRHLTAWYTGKDTDPETGESHLSHALCGVMMLLEKEIHELGPDDRPWSARDRESDADSEADCACVDEERGLIHVGPPHESAGIGGKWSRHGLRLGGGGDRVEPEQECVDVAAARRK